MNMTLSNKKKLREEQPKSFQIKNQSYNQRLKNIKLASLSQRRLREQLIEMLKYLNGFTTSSAIKTVFDYDLNDQTRNNGEKLIV